MSRVCALTGKKVMVGNNVSHANNHTKRRFLPNLQNVSFLSNILGSKVKLRLSVRGIKTVEHNGGIDAYLMSTPNSRLSPEALTIKKRLQIRQAKPAA
jgi:large subunit ribosomal protein L28